MLSSYFDRMLERETEQGKRENLLFQTIYDMVYQNMEKYGAEFAGIQAGNSATERMTGQSGTECMILETDGTITLEGSLKLPQDEIRRLAEEMLRTMDPGADQVYGCPQGRNVLLSAQHYHRSGDGFGRYGISRDPEGSERHL